MEHTLIKNIENRFEREIALNNKQEKQRLKAIAFMSLSVVTIGLIPAVSGVLLAGTLGTLVLSCVTAAKNLQLANANLHVVEAMKREKFSDSDNYKQLDTLVDSFDNKKENMKNIVTNIQKLRNVETNQLNNKLDI